MKNLPISKPSPLNNGEFLLPEDGWYHIAPIGEFYHYSGVNQVIDAQSVDSMVSRFQLDSEQPNFPGLLTDYDHFSNDTDKSSEAAGWLIELQGRPTGLWAQIRWSDNGEKAVKGGRYRLVSPVWNPSDCEDLGGDRIRPLRLDRVALTNDPNLKGLTPLTNRNTLPDDPANAPAGTPADIQNKGTNTMKKIATTLGLSADASEEAIVGELTKLQNRAAQAEASQTALKNRLDTLEATQADADLDTAGIAKDHADRPKIKEMLIANRDAGLALLKLVKPAATEPRTPMTNRTTAKTPNVATGSAPVKNRMQEQRVAIDAEKIGNRSNEDAYRIAKSKNPELFATAEEAS